MHKIEKLIADFLSDAKNSDQTKTKVSSFMKW